MIDIDEKEIIKKISENRRSIEGYIDTTKQLNLRKNVRIF